LMHRAHGDFLLSPKATRRRIRVPGTADRAPPSAGQHDAKAAADGVCSRTSDTPGPAVIE
ncbi:MAG TPA: hypothetical protein VGP30_06410, partial [Candidatus Limnocylindrales bacterium]|nr:hypothetical protein [Candidatus Limnocylindrales bacterium]